MEGGKISKKNVAKHNIYTADFETSGQKNLDKDERVHVWLWSLVNVETKQAYYGTSIKTFFLKDKNVGC